MEAPRSDPRASELLKDGRKSRATFADTVVDTDSKPMESSSGAAAKKMKARRRSSLGGELLLGEARAVLGLGGRTQTLLPELQASAFGFHAGTSEDELERLAHLFATVPFAPNQPLPTAPVYYVQSGTVTVRSREWRVSKGAGEWIFNPKAIATHEVDPLNYAWSYEGILGDARQSEADDGSVYLSSEEMARETRRSSIAHATRLLNLGGLFGAPAHHNPSHLESRRDSMNAPMRHAHLPSLASLPVSLHRAPHRAMPQTPESLPHTDRSCHLLIVCVRLSLCVCVCVCVWPITLIAFAVAGGYPMRNLRRQRRRPRDIGEKQAARVMARWGATPRTSRTTAVGK